MEVSKITLQITKTNNRNLEFTDAKKITISTSTKNNKTYRTYQINLNQEYISMLIGKKLSEIEPKTKIQLYLSETHKQHYQIKKIADTFDKTIEIKITINNKKTTAPLTLPKNDMEYIKAYDTYLETLEKINDTIDAKDKQFKTIPLKATVLLKFNVNKKTNNLDTELHITNIRTKIDDEFINYIKQEYNDTIPEWLNTLITDWNDEYLNRILNIN